MSTFSLQLDAFANKVGFNADIVTRKIILGVARSVIEKSPVDTGRFKGNWQLGISEKPSGEITDAAQFDRSAKGVVKSTAPSLVRIKERVPPRPAGNLYYITNNLDYAEKLENGHSQQAPNGMVELTVLEFQRFINEAARELS